MSETGANRQKGTRRRSLELWLCGASLTLLMSAVLLSCRPLPPRPIVDSVAVEGLENVDDDDVEQGLSTAETPLLFGFVPRVLEYVTYDPEVLRRDLSRIERYLRARGYYEAKVIAARVIRSGPHNVRVEVRVQEGEPVHVARIDPGLASLPLEVMLKVNRARKMGEGDLFDEARFEDDRRRVERTLFDAGYAFAKVDLKASVDLPSHGVHLVYRIEPGPLARYGKVTIAGLSDIPEGPVRDNLSLREGDIYNQSELEDAEQALKNLAVFSNVEIRPDLTHRETAVVPIQVQVRESALRTIRLGGGARFDVLRLSGHLAMGWEHRNFLGGMRHFSVQANPGVTLFPTRIDRLEPWKRYLPENRVGVELRQPSFFEGRTTGALAAEYNVYPLLYPLPDDVPPESERIIGYHEIKTSARVQRAFFSHHLEVVPSYNWQANYPFTYQRGAPPGLGSVRVSFPELVTTLAFIDDPISPHSGFVLSNSFQVAGHGFGGTVDDVRIRPEIKGYLPVKKGVLAARLAFGFLFPSGYGDRGLGAGETGLTAENAEVIEDQQKLLFRAFYSGGPSSNRGYPFRTVGPHGPIGFLVPTGVDCVTNPNQPGCIRPLGGLTLWEASIEARIPFPWDSIYGVLFVDASDLTREVGRLRTSVPHLSPGFGLRYKTPIGPIRLDVGMRVPGAQAIGKKELPEEEGRPGRDLFGFFPGAIHLAILEAF